MQITMAHGSGGRLTGELIETIFAPAFDNEVLLQMEDSAVVPGAGRLAVTTDSFVVDPLFFPGGDIGKLSICGTVNDLLMRGAEPKYLTCGFLLQEGLSTDLLKRAVQSMAQTAREAGVKLIAGDTKVIPGDGGLYINTAGVGFVPDECRISAACCRPGDAVLVSGTLGDHHAAILSSRLGIQNEIKSDCAPLGALVNALKQAEIDVHALRDITRGGLATVCRELAGASACRFQLEEEKLPVKPAVRDLCGLLGLDPLYMGNEGCLVAVVPQEQAEKALNALRACGQGVAACQIGQVEEGDGALFLRTSIGGQRRLEVLQGEGLPRIC